MPWPGRIWLFCCVLGTACAVRGPVLTGHAVELDSTPYFPQQAYQCGPAAAAAVLTAAGFTAAPESLAPEIYLPARRGSLQLEIIAAARRRGAIPFVIDPGLQSLLAELRAGRPVLVLQNLGLSQVPAWHYAVVVGVDPAADRFILRSGTNGRLEMAARTFMRTWEAGGEWGLVVLRPGDLPADPEPRRYLQAVAGLESTGHYGSAEAGYLAALARWPSEPVALLGLANAMFGLGRYAEAESTYRRLLTVEPEHVIARNNLAEALAAQGCHDEAIDILEKAAVEPSMTDRLRSLIGQTREEIAARARAGGPGRCRQPSAATQ